MSAQKEDHKVLSKGIYKEKRRVPKVLSKGIYKEKRRVPKGTMVPLK